MGAIAIICNEVIASHPWNQKYKVSLADISNRDYPGKDYLPPKADALDIDTYELDTFCLRDKTMDAAVGICDFDGSSHTSKRLSLVELRMNYQSCNTLKHNSLLEKVSHTRALLAGHAIDPQVYFVFTDQVAPSVIRLFSSWKRENKADVKNWKAIGVSSYIEERMKVEADVPYTPHHDLSNIDTDFVKAASSPDAIIALLTYWKKEINQESVQYHANEVRAIKEAVNSAMQKVDINLISDESEKQLISMYWEDIK